eukprot:gene12339-6011_t
MGMDSEKEEDFSPVSSPSPVLLSVKYPYSSVWNLELQITKLENHQFQEVFTSLVNYIKGNSLPKTRKFRLKTYPDCFIASEVVNYIFEWESKLFEMKTEECILETFQVLIDVHAIQHIVEPEKKFSNSSHLFRFTIPFHNDDMKNSFIATVTENFNQFKLVQSFISNRNNVENLYNSMMSSYEGFELSSQKYKNKMIEKSFLGYEAVIWMKEKFPLDNYGAVLLGECMRQIRAFESLKVSTKFQNGQFFYIMSTEKKFNTALKLIYEKSGKISKRKNGKSLHQQIIDMITNLMNYGNSNDPDKEDDINIIEYDDDDDDDDDNDEESSQQKIDKILNKK